MFFILKRFRAAQQIQMPDVQLPEGGRLLDASELGGWAPSPSDGGGSSIFSAFSATEWLAVRRTHMSDPNSSWLSS